jgi:iron complex transport system substrate-binding protein
LAPNLTEIIYALGAGDKLAAVTNDCDYPLEAQRKDKTGPFGTPALERILFFKPDLVVYSEVSDLSVIAQLRSLKIPVIQMNVTNLAELEGAIAYLGELTDKKGQALQLTLNINRRIQAIQKKAGRQKQLTVLMPVWDAPLMAVGKESYLNEIITMAGGKNILVKESAALSMAYPTVSDELILAGNPQVIVFLKKYSNYFQKGELNKIEAVQNQKVIFFPNPDLLLRPGPRLVDGLELLYQLLHETK